MINGVRFLMPLCAAALFCLPAGVSGSGDATAVGKLPPPQQTGTVSLEEALTARRSIRSFSGAGLREAELSQLLWAAQGVTDPSLGFRTAPSAGATFPLELYVVGPSGVFHYQPDSHTVKRLTADDRRGALAEAANGQEFIRKAGGNFVITAVPTRTSARYGARATRYVDMEAGHAAQNLLLQAVALGLGGVPVGAFNDQKVAALLGIDGKREVPLYIVPVGAPVE